MVKFSWCCRQCEADTGTLGWRVGGSGATIVRFDRCLTIAGHSPVEAIKHVCQALGSDA